jgi:N-acetylmuramoyl-L-alanine amidase
MQLSAVRFITLHCSATRPNQVAGVREIRQWHRKRGFSDIGYHFVVRRDGTVERGRPLTQMGAHVQGWNEANIGICLEGGIDDDWKPANNFTRAQWRALKPLVVGLKAKAKRAKVVGHRDFPGVSKACPCFDAKAWARDNGIA